MGNGFSRTPTGESYVDAEIDEMAGNSSSCDNETSDTQEEFHDTCDTAEDEYTRAREHEMIEFNKVLALKREQRREVIAKHKTEKENLKKSLENERKLREAKSAENEILKDILKQHNITIPETTQVQTQEGDIMTAVNEMKEDLEKLKNNNSKLRRDLAESNLALQTANTDILNLNYENVESRKQIQALKDVVSVSKTMINLREEQLNELKDKLAQIEQSLADREANLLSTDLKQEYERQLQNIRVLRGLYEERARLAEVTRLNIQRELEEQKRLTSVEVNKCEEQSKKIAELEKTSETLSDTIENKNDQIKNCQEEARGLRAEMSTVNNLFSQVLLGYKSKHNWDQLVHRLEENHGILTHMVEREDDSESSSALPKLLLELVNQVDENDNKKELLEERSEEATDIECKVSESQNASAEEIVQNLPKVWKVLMELLSHQNSNETVPFEEKVTTCYKTVETASGSVQVPSVSQTYIRLKDLIVEKLTLIKEVNRMKQLNSHLESRLGEQERRLCLVTSELSKTWHVVGRLRRHHHQLHTHEKILKYELQQKRKLLTELKVELEYCREKWEKAREKNNQSEKDWRKLRAEFSSRKTKINPSSCNNSAESGYSDERQSESSSDSNDESECVNDVLLRSNKKTKTSFDNVLDSSADFNLAAEREDPISDMLDVADLPLDSHELEDNAEDCPRTSSAHVETEDISISESSHIKSDKNCGETEDEVCDSFSEEQSAKDIMEGSSSSTHNPDIITDTGPEVNDLEKDINTAANSADDPAFTLPRIDPAAILESIRKQNEMLAKKDEKFQNLERSSQELLKKSKETLSKSMQITNILDNILGRPGTSSDTIQDENVNDAASSIINSDIPQEDQQLKTNDIVNSEKVLITSTKTSDTGAEADETDRTVDSESTDETNVLPNEITLMNDESENEPNINNIETDVTEIQNTNDPSTSQTNVDHESRFAARELRLKRLEEQTKSLVNKVNDTASKRVKISYKLDELHNIYGSESSRAGTPSGENGDDETKENEKSED